MARHSGSCVMELPDNMKTPDEIFAEEIGAFIGNVADTLALEEYKARMRAAAQAGKYNNMSEQEQDDFDEELRWDTESEIRSRIFDILWVLDSHPEYIYEFESLVAKLAEEENTEK